MAPETKAGPLWRTLLGDELAARVARIASAGPAEWCRATILAAVERAEGRPATDPANKAQTRCSHPEKDRSYGRCRRCGLRGLPNIIPGGKT